MEILRIICLICFVLNTFLSFYKYSREDENAELKASHLNGVLGWGCATIWCMMA